MLGIGSPFGDDRVGWEVAETLQQDPWVAARNDLAVLACDRPGAVLVELLQGAELAILIDAVQAGLDPGTVLSFEGADLHTQFGVLPSSHGFGLAAALELAKALGDLPAELVVFGIEIGPVLAGKERQDLGPAVAAAVPAAVARILERLRRHAG